MSHNVIELNDSGVRVTRDGVVVCVSPGIVLLAERSVVCGVAAQARAQLQPRDIYQHFWQQLNEVPLRDARRFCRHHADLAYHHLASVLDAAGRPATALLVVPGHYDDAQLGLLLGIAQALRLQVTGLIDSSVAQLAGCAPAGRYAVVDIHRHHVCLSTVEVNTQVTRVASTAIEQAGLARIETAAVDLVAAALLSQAHFDALHEAHSAQLLHDQLPAWLQQARQHREVAVDIDYHGQRFSARIAARDFVHVVSMVLATVCERLPANVQVLTSAALGALPGALALLAPARALSVDAAYRGLAAHHGTFIDGSNGVSYTLQLPAAPTPQFEIDSATITRHAARRAPSHLLVGHDAYALAAAPLYLKANGGVAATADGALCALALQDEQAVLRVHGVAAHINGVPAAGASVVCAGDHITLGAGRALFIAIAVADTRAA